MTERVNLSIDLANAVFVTTVPATDAATEGGERIIGFSALSVFYDRAGYDGVTDLAYYIAPEWQGRGAGKAAYQPQV